MKTIWTIPVALAFAAVAAAPAQADMTTSDTAVCTPVKLGRCKDNGECQWKDARERDKNQPLVIQFKAKKAFIRRGGKEYPFGVVIEDKVEGGKRMIVVSRDGSKDSKKTMAMSIDQAGMMDGSRSGGRVKFKATCKAS